MSSLPSSDMAYLALRQAIIEQAILPGAKLPEDEIAIQFGISRTPVRAVLARLQSEGLVEMGGRRSASVARPSLEEARQIFVVRRALEREVVRLASQRWQPAFGPRLEQIIRDEESAKASGDARASIRLAGDFHIALAEMTGNGLLLRYLSETVSRCSLILALYSRPHSSDCAVSEHQAIVDGLRAGDAAHVINIMDAHVGAIERRALLPEEDVGPSGLANVLTRYAQVLRSRN
jgi:DNA-binding GntR family transcriptional regulator